MGDDGTVSGAMAPEFYENDSFAEARQIAERARQVVTKGFPVASTKFVTKDSGKREEYDSGMVRDTEEGKARFDLILPRGIPYEEQMLTRFAEHMARGAAKYEDRNWERANSEVELARYKSSAFRHLMQWLCGQGDEDHAAAVMFNLLAHETLAYKLSKAPK